MIKDYKERMIVSIDRVVIAMCGNQADRENLSKSDIVLKALLQYLISRGWSGDTFNKYKDLT